MSVYTESKNIVNVMKCKRVDVADSSISVKRLTGYWIARTLCDSLGSDNKTRKLWIDGDSTSWKMQVKLRRRTLSGR
jgi:hypothetical protein